MAFYTTNFLANRRNQWMKSIQSIQVQVGSVWHTGDIQKKAVEGDSVVIHAVFSSLHTVAATITRSRVLDVRGEVAAEQAENITKVAGQGAMIRLVLPIREP
ncbi:MAG: hypothetical protein PHU51_04925 [Candidatus Nanoarchaeia archaeon]|nr:hypothetical protein [Candidatus Nanoarchaeia archaeon]